MPLRPGAAMTTLHTLIGPEAAITIIQEHIPSLTDTAETMIESRYEDQNEDMENPWDWADFAYRQCSCGIYVDGFYEYVDHLVAVLREGKGPA